MSTAAGGLVIDWTQMTTYNTIMALATGAALLSLAALGRTVARKEPFHAEGWALNLGVLGFILTLTGAHMTLTWPFAKYFPFDNIIFGEPSLAFGVILLAAAFYAWKRAAALRDPATVGRELAAAAQPLSIFVTGLGLSMIAIACAGIAFQLFAAPPEEPISGRFAQYPWLEAIFISGLYATVGLTALLYPFFVRQASAGESGGAVQKVTGVLLVLDGLAFLLFGALNYYTHIGLIINTMPKP
ncbi:DUF981 family protein [Deinococcus radiopugnans]|uniref:DUF981 family protein n=1 Tax=Deinococcus radiopugnans ATCC 19172 TaxID=585398 RepID=A0A5C4XVR1_9DEIO|nr:DUF981 family protein [Deinococcus radiopugnans]MBB6018537.1 putative membrane protein [Deinococcus radiopugnans ATCC 19172]TNM67313.1 DUF981 family protein [Deinococcus radiopugnans ATCC 19172]